VLGSLSVAVPAAPDAVLPDWVELPEGNVGATLGNIAQVTEYTPADGGGHYLYHRSMAEFLAAPTVDDDGTRTRNRYATPPRDQHERITRYYLDNFQGAWSACDTYGLRQLVSHLQARRTLTRPPTQRDRIADQILSVVLDGAFRQAQREQLGSISATLADVRVALDIAAEHDDLVALLCCAGAYRTTLRMEGLAQSVFRAVDQGDFEAAHTGVGVYGVVPDWVRAAELYLAWEAVERLDVAAARRAIANAQGLPMAAAAPLCYALMMRIARRLAGAPGSPGSLQAVLATFQLGHDTDWLLQRYGDVQPLGPAEEHAIRADLESELNFLETQFARGDVESTGEGRHFDDERMGYFAMQLEEKLVKLAAHPFGQHAIDRALAPMLVNPYPRYRDMALGAIGSAALAVPDPSWARPGMSSASRRDRPSRSATFRGRHSRMQCTSRRTL
jgi:hypothetical protein